jgi:hypothetical protein
MWQEEYTKLNSGEKEEFTRILNYLMARTFVLRDKYDDEEKKTRISLEYRFIERYFELYREYFKVGGWELQKDSNYGVISLYNSYGTNRTRLDKITTLILYTLRLIYEEEREKLSLKREILTNVGDVIKKMINLGLVNKKPSDRDISSAFSLLKNFNIIDRTEGRFEDPETQVIVYPSILFIVTNDKVASIYELLDEDAGDEAAVDMEEDEE